MLENFSVAHGPNDTSKTAEFIIFLTALLATILWSNAISIFATPIHRQPSAIKRIL
jgi:hypothetical protein